jgi:hypothetical protein
LFKIASSPVTGLGSTNRHCAKPITAFLGNAIKRFGYSLVEIDEKLFLSLAVRGDLGRAGAAYGHPEGLTGVA